MPGRDPRRRFNARERAALLIAAAGHCGRCGDLLPPDFHADHCDPWARGGATDVINGQALCPACNYSKGDQPATFTAPLTGPYQAGSAGGTARAVSPRSRRNHARTYESAGAGHGGALECHKETLS